MEEDIKKEMGFQKEHEKISKTYARIYTIIFKFTLPVLLIVGSFFISNKIIQSNYLKNISIFPDKDINQIQKETLIKDFNNNISQNIDNKDIEIQIIQGKLYTKGNLIYSQDNLIKYKGYVVPKLFTIEKNAPISDITYFDTGFYKISKLEEFVKNIIFIDKSNLNIKIEDNKQLILDESIEKTFNLTCFFSNKITDKMCNYYIKEFLKYFFVYNIKNDIQGLKKIDEKISITQNYKEFCEGIKNYIMYSNDPENNLKEIIENCGNIQSTDEFTKIKNFIEIQKELNEGYIKDKYYSFRDLNSYKLLSFQQILYNDITSRKIDTLRLNNYISFLKNLIKKNNMEQFYKEEIYWFNNYFLIKNLEASKEENLFPIVKDLYSINKGESIFGIPGLTTKIKNKNLETYQQVSTGQEYNIIEIMSGAQTSLTKTLLKELYNITFFTITDHNIILKDTVGVTGYFHILNRTIKTNLLLERNQNNLIIKSINLQKYSSLTKVINNIIQNENRGINKIYQYINDNIDTYGVEDSGIPIINIGFCEILKAKINYNIVECSEKNVLIEKDGINYKIFISNDKAYDVNISNTEIENSIKEQLQKSGYNNISLTETIIGILSYKVEDEIITGNQNSILITEIFQKYLGTEPVDVVESKGSFFLTFALQEINFIAEFDMISKTIKAMYFQDITQDGNPLNIKDFSLLLSDANKTQINQFLISPINYIKNLDSFAYINYENKFGKENNTK
ncbi:MAG: hypothetical protein WAZ12_00245 [Candidatus Absconditicoccaceae bacterium]